MFELERGSGHAPLAGIFQDWGLVPYQHAWRSQRSQVAARLQNPQLPDLLIVAEHPPVYTLGKGASLQYVKFDPQSAPYEIHRIERGGEVTYHCPGQLVAYPIVNLQHYRTDLHWYLRQLEAVVIRLLQGYGLSSQRQPGLTGVWLDDVKVAAIGIKVKRWITMHGFALNVCPDLSGFEHIVPCGITNQSVGSLAQYLPEISVAQVRLDLKDIFAEIFELQWIEASRIDTAWDALSADDPFQNGYR